MELWQQKKQEISTHKSSVMKLCLCFNAVLRRYDLELMKAMPTRDATS